VTNAHEFLEVLRSGSTNEKLAALGSLSADSIQQQRVLLCHALSNSSWEVVNQAIRLLVADGAEAAEIVKAQIGQRVARPENYYRCLAEFHDPTAFEFLCGLAMSGSEYRPKILEAIGQADPERLLSLIQAFMRGGKLEDYLSLLGLLLQHRPNTDLREVWSSIADAGIDTQQKILVLMARAPSAVVNNISVIETWLRAAPAQISGMVDAALAACTIDQQHAMSEKISPACHLWLPQFSRSLLQGGSPKIKTTWINTVCEHLWVVEELNPRLQELVAEYAIDIWAEFPLEDIVLLTRLPNALVLSPILQFLLTKSVAVPENPSWWSEFFTSTALPHFLKNLRQAFLSLEQVPISLVFEVIDRIHSPSVEEFLLSVLGLFVTPPHRFSPFVTERALRSLATRRESMYDDLLLVYRNQPQYVRHQILDNLVHSIVQVERFQERTGLVQYLTRFPPEDVIPRMVDLYFYPDNPLFSTVHAYLSNFPPAAYIIPFCTKMKTIHNPEDPSFAGNAAIAHLQSINLDPEVIHALPRLDLPTLIESLTPNSENINVTLIGLIAGYGAAAEPALDRGIVNSEPERARFLIVKRNALFQHWVHEVMGRRDLEIQL
jgi:hypothetical protein